MEFTATHMRYLLAIYRLSRNRPDISSSDIAREMKVKKSSVAKMLRTLSEKEWVRKRPYGKVHLTEAGRLLAQEYDRRVESIAQKFSSLDFPLTAEKLRCVSCVLASTLPEKCFAAACQPSVSS